MHIIIDGYNLIRQSDTLRRYEKYGLERGRKALIQFLSAYRKQRGHKITVVFDGWEGGPALEERDRTEGIDIIYSHRGEKADDVIKRMVQRAPEEILVVTSDRNIADFVNRRREKTAMASREFEEKITEIISVSRPFTKEGGEGFSGISEEGGSEFQSDEAYEKDRDYEIPHEDVKKKGPSRRLSRKQKTAMARIQKL